MPQSEIYDSEKLIGMSKVNQLQMVQPNKNYHKQGKVNY